MIPCLRLLARAWPIFCFNLRSVHVAALDLGSGGSGLRTRQKRNFAYEYTAIRYTESFVITLQSSQYDLIDIEEIPNYHHHYFKLNPHFLRYVKISEIMGYNIVKMFHGGQIRGI